MDRDHVVQFRERFPNLKKVAIVVDSLFMPGGAEKSMMTYLKLFPNAEVFTTAYFPEYFWPIDAKIHTYFHPSFISRFFFKFRPFRLVMQSYYNLLSPIAFESFDFKGFDLIISLSARCAKGVITPYDSTHIHYVLTPPRAEWDNDTKSRAFRSKGINKLFSKYISNYFRIWDLVASKRADYTVSQSIFIAEKVRKTYRVDSEVLYPGIDLYYFQDAKITKSLINEIIKKGLNDIFDLSENESDYADLTVYENLKTLNGKETLVNELSNKDKIRSSFSGGINLSKQYFLSVSRLYDYKRVDWAIKSCIETGKELIVAGVGPDIVALKKIAKGHRNIRFVGRVSDDLVRFLYKYAKGLLFCGIEDFGMVPVEAMAQGCPVIALNIGGGAEIVTEQTGVLFNNFEELLSRLREFDRTRYNRDTIIERAKRFSEVEFSKQFGNYLDKVLQ